MNEMSFQEQINAVNAEVQQVNEQIMKFNFKLENHQNNHNKALQEANQKFKTSDFDELVAIAKERAENNDRKMAEIREKLTNKRKELMEKVRLEREITEGTA